MAEVTVVLVDDHPVVHDGVRAWLEQDPKRRDVPLTVAQSVERTALGLRRIDLEDFVEGPACLEHAQIGIEYQKRFGDRVDDRLREQVCLFEVPHWENREHLGQSVTDR